jgi:hypothetical protein
MIFVAFLRVMSGMIFLRITTTRGIEFSQSLCKMTFQGRSGLALLAVWVRCVLLICVALICWETFCQRLVPCASSYRLCFQLARKLTSERTLTRGEVRRIPSATLGE